MPSSRRPSFDIGRYSTMRASLKNITPTSIVGSIFVKAFDSTVCTNYGVTNFFDCTWSYVRGYRYNYKGNCPTLYLAGNNLTASAEIGPRSRDRLLGGILRPAQPYLYINVLVTASVLNLTDAPTRKELGVTKHDLVIPTSRWDNDMENGIWSITHYIGKAALGDDRFDGILYPPYPSNRLLYHSDSQNVAIFMDSKSPYMASPRSSSCVLDVIDDHKVLEKLGLTF